MANRQAPGTDSRSDDPQAADETQGPPSIVPLIVILGFAIAVILWLVQRGF